MSAQIILINKCLLEVRIGHNHENVHPAWQDETNEGYLICYEINLVFEGNTVYSIKPGEIELDGRYPGLGIILEKIDESILPCLFDASSFPVSIDKIQESDHLGEDTINQYSLVCENGSTLIIRHVLPPMTMGLKLVKANA